MPVVLIRDEHYWCGSGQSRRMEREPPLKSHTFKKEYLVIPLLLISLAPVFFLVRGVSGVRAANAIQHYLYVFPDHTVYVYDNSFIHFFVY